MTGKEVSHPTDDHLAADVFTSQDDEVFSEGTMNHRQFGTDLRKVFERPEFRVMIVANKFQTGFDQPKLCAMYLDKKIANAVEIVQTLSRLNRTTPGKDTTFVVDFVNDPQAVLDAFAKYDDGAKIQDVQNPNVVYDLQSELDKARVYVTEEVEAYKVVRFKSAAAYAAGEQAQHKELYAATSAPTQRFNDKVYAERAAIQAAEASFEAAKMQDNEPGMKLADATRANHAEALKSLLDFKGGLTRFGSLYTYIAQTIDLGDPSTQLTETETMDIAFDSTIVQIRIHSSRRATIAAVRYFLQSSKHSSDFQPPHSPAKFPPAPPRDRDAAGQHRPGFAGSTTINGTRSSTDEPQPDLAGHHR